MTFLWVLSVFLETLWLGWKEQGSRLDIAECRVLDLAWAAQKDPVSLTKMLLEILDKDGEHKETASALKLLMDEKTWSRASGPVGQHGAAA